MATFTQQKAVGLLHVLADFATLQALIQSISYSFIKKKRKIIVDHNFLLCYIFSITDKEQTTIRTYNLITHLES